MCGICGLASSTPLPPGSDRHVREMNSALAHRGPDGSGIWADEHFCVGHTRLAIIDLSSAAAQPMAGNGGRHLLVCNGEIYNYRALRKVLAEEGYPFQSQTDIEVILPLFDRYGPGCAEHLVGMFAFAVWDRGERTLHLFRDRVGEKPLFYAHSGDTLAFASEIQALLRLPWVDASLDEEALLTSFAYKTPPAPMTFFKGIRTLPPACRLSFRAGRVDVARYWTLAYSPDRRRGLNDTVDQYGELVTASVDNCLVADVPVGVMLSGGIDSGTIAAVASKLSRNIHTFCIAADMPGAPEDPDMVRARQSAAHLPVVHTDVRFQPGDISQLPRILSLYGQPFNEPPSLYADSLAREMRTRVSVVLSGSAADEIFGGYNGYNAVLRDDRRRNLFRRVPPGLAALLPTGLGARIAAAALRAHQPPSKWRADGLDDSARARMQRLCSPDFLRRWKDHSVGRHVAQPIDDSRADSLLEAAMVSDLLVYHQPSHCTMPDISGMAHSLEYRAPFLDHRLIEFAATIPRSMLVPSVDDTLRNKYVAKEYLARLLPREHVYQPKMGFGYAIDVKGMLRTQWRPIVEEQVLRGRYLSLGIFTPEGARWGVENSLFTVWLLLTFSIWADMFVFNEPHQAVAERMRRLLGQGS